MNLIPLILFLLDDTVCLLEKWKQEVKAMGDLILIQVRIYVLHCVLILREQV